MAKNEILLYCSFCGKPQHEVKKLIAGPSVFICNECVELCDYIVEDGESGTKRIRRTIVFEPEHAQAGIAILANFSRVVHQKYPDIPVEVSIEQVGLTVTLVIVTPSGELERIQETLNTYGMVVRGQVPPTALFENPLHVHELKSKLEITALELRMTKEIHEHTNSLHGERIRSLESQVQQLHSLIGAGLSGAKELQAIIQLLIERKSKNSEIESAVAYLLKELCSDFSQRDTAKASKALSTIKEKDSGLFNDIKDVLKDVVSDVSASAITGWLGAVLSSLPR